RRVGRAREAGQDQRERRALVRAAHAAAAAVGLGDRVDDRQAEADAVAAARAARVDAREPLEDARQLLLRDPAALVGDVDGDVTLEAARSQLDRVALRRVRDRVLDQRVE